MEDQTKNGVAGSKGRRWLLIFAIPSTFLYAGAYYGWGPMQLVLEQNGIFHSKCGEDVPLDQVCDAQTSALLNVRLISQLTIIGSPLLGELSDRKGARNVAYLLTALTFTGLLLIIVSDRTGVDWIMYLAFSCLALVAWSGGLLTVETGLVFQGKRRSRVISALNACYDAGAITYLGLWGIAEVSDATLTPLVAGYLGLAVLCLGGFSLSWAKVLPEEEQENTEQATEDRPSESEVEAEDDLEMENLKAAERAAHSVQAFGNEIEPPTKHESTIQQLAKRDEVVEADTSLKSKEHETDQVDNEVSTNETKTKTTSFSTSTDSVRGYVVIANRSKNAQLLSEPVILLCAFFSFYLTSNVWTLVTARDFLKYLGDDDYNNLYLTIFTLMTPASLVALPFEDIAIQKYGFYYALQAINVLAVAHGTIKVATENLNVQILGFILFSFFRCFLFAVTFCCLPNIVSLDLTGRAVGIFYLTGGLASFINIPLSNLAVNQLDGNFFIPNMVYVILSIPFFYVVWRIGKGLEREDKAKATMIVTRRSTDAATIMSRRSSLYQGGQVARFSAVSRSSVVVAPSKQSNPSHVSLHGTAGERKGSTSYSEKKAHVNRRSSV